MDTETAKPTLDQVAVSSRAAQLGFYRGEATDWTGFVSVELG